MTGPATLIADNFENLTDPRVDRGFNHDLLEMVFIALTASICSANGWADVERFAKAKIDWFKQYIKLENGVPSHDTFGRVFAKLDTAEFLTAMHQWIDHFAEALNDRGVAIDGKVLRGSFDKAAGKSALHTLTAFATDTRLVLRQMSVDDKSNEIPAVPKLLELLELAGAVVTLDAMHCQKETAKAIIDADADYILTVKGNQGNLSRRLLELFIGYNDLNNQVPGLRRHVTVETSHGRKERREYWVIDVPDEAIFKQWEGIASIGMVYRQRETGTGITEEPTYFISSLAPTVKEDQSPPPVALGD